MNRGRNSLQRGDVVLVTFPFTDLSGSKKRPAVVLQTETPQSVDTILAFISSVLPKTPGKNEIVLLPTQRDFAATGLKVPSVIRLDKLATIDRHLVVRKLGSLTPKRLYQIDEVLLRTLEISVERYLVMERQRLAEIAQKQGYENLLAELLK